MSSVLAARALRRSFGKRSAMFAVDGVDLRIEPGQIVAMLGPNGAGKTTTVKMCSTLLAPTSGSLTIAGVDAISRPREARRHLGLVLGGDHGFYGRANARDNLLFFCDVVGVPTRQRTRRVVEALEAVGLAESATRRVQEFSRGMVQRLHIARSLLNAPRLLLLDEPTNGLDPEIAREVRTLVRTLAHQGAAVLLTTHYLHEAEQLADHIMVLLSGRVAVEGRASDIAAHAGVTHVTTLRSPDEPAALAAVIAQAAPVGLAIESREQGTVARVSWESVPDHTALRATLERSGLRLDDFSTRAATLEESYLALVDRGGVAS